MRLTLLSRSSNGVHHIMRHLTHINQNQGNVNNLLLLWDVLVIMECCPLISRFPVALCPC